MWHICFPEQREDSPSELIGLSLRSEGLTHAHFLTELGTLHHKARSPHHKGLLRVKQGQCRQMNSCSSVFWVLPLNSTYSIFLKCAINSSLIQGIHILPSSFSYLQILI